MNLLINTSNLNKGGALQVAHSFLSEIKNNKEHIFHVVLSNAISKQIDYESYPKNFKFFLYSLKPTVLKTLIGHDSFLDQLERSIKPNCVFTVFGPSYWIPKTNHVMGYARPHYIYPESPFFKIISLKDKIILNIIKALHKRNLKLANSYFCVETEDVRHRLSYFLSIDIQRIFTISNTYHSVFDNWLMSNENNQSSLGLLPYTNVFRFITISAFYPHKNLAILKKVIPILRGRGIKCEFVLTIDNKKFKTFDKYSDYIKNVGPVRIVECPFLYENSNALFLPTLLECFTSSYPEAMKMGIPILTSDLSFARDICGVAAEYFDPLNPEDIVDKIEKIMSDHAHRNFLIEQGKKRLEIFETSKSRAEKYLAICDQIVKENESITK